LDDVWTFKFAETEDDFGHQWMELGQEGSGPGARAYHFMIRASKGTLVGFGETADGTLANDIYKVDIKAETKAIWTQIKTVNEGPSARSNLTASVLDDDIII